MVDGQGAATGRNRPRRIVESNAGALKGPTISHNGCIYVYVVSCGKRDTERIGAFAVGPVNRVVDNDVVIGIQGQGNAAICQIEIIVRDPSGYRDIAIVTIGSRICSDRNGRTSIQCRNDVSNLYLIVCPCHCIKSASHPGLNHLYTGIRCNNLNVAWVKEPETGCSSSSTGIYFPNGDQSRLARRLNQASIT